MNHWEASYTGLCEWVLKCGHLQPSRAGDTIATVGQNLTISMSQHHFPLLTTRRMYYKPVFGELAVFLRGFTNNGAFMEFGCNYWTTNARAFPPNRDVVSDADLELGPIYGKQWRNFGGIDQIAVCRGLLMHDPYTRRAVVTAMNPAEEHLMCLPPCHTNFQFCVVGDRLDLCVYMRSVDLCLGLPSDIALYYALLILMASDTGYAVGKLHFSFGNAHIYKSHFKNLEIQLERISKRPPTWYLRPQESMRNYTDNFMPDDLVIEDYNPQERINYELAV